MAFSRQTILTSFLWKLTERCSVQGISFIVTIVLARLLQPSEYGQIALIMVFINLANVIIDGGLNTALIQKKNSDEKDFSTILYVSLMLSGVIYIILLSTAPAIAHFFRQPDLTPVIRVQGLSLFLYAVNSVQRAYISKHMLFKKLFISSLAAIIGSGSVGVLLALHGYGVWALVFYDLTSSFLMMSVMWFTVKWRPMLVFSTERFHTLFNYGWKIFLTNFITSLFVNIRSLIIGKVYAPASLAFFDRGKQLPSLVMENINTSIQTVLFPTFSAEQDDKERIKNMVRRSIKTSSLVIFPLMIGLFAVAKPLILLLLTEKWLMAVPFVQIFCVAYLLMPVQIANIEAVKSMGRSDTILRLELIKKVLEVTILVVTVFINVYAIAIGVIVYNFICIFINLHPNKRILNYTLSQQMRDALPPLAAAIVMGVAVYSIQWLPLSNAVILPLQIATGIVVYTAICHFCKLESFRYAMQMVLSMRKNKNL